MSDLDAELRQIFHDETVGRLDEMDAALLAAESGGTGPDTIDALFRDAHTIKGAAGMLGLDDIRALAHAAEDVLSAARGAGTLPSGLAAPLLHATGLLRTLTEGREEPIAGLLDELAASQRLIGGEDGEKAGRSPAEGAGPEPPAAGPVPEPRAEAAPKPVPDTGPVPEAVPVPGAGPAPEAAGSGGRPELAGPAGGSRSGRRRTIRIPAEKIDHLIDVVGEVVQDRQRLGHALGGDSDSAGEAADLLSPGDRMLDELKEAAVGIRTLPLSAITGPMPRALHDLARQVGKEVDFVVTGADTELDRVILESLSEPLTHLLRNSLDHGIEPVAEREAAGKPARGRIELGAESRGRLVRIAVTDDGRGVTPELAEEARQLGSLVDLLTRPGFSTSAEVTDLGGRGVGLDAVRDYVRSVGGVMEISSEPGHGMEVSLMLPLALALAEVLLFRRGGTVYGVPLAAVDEVVIVTGCMVLEGRTAMEVRGIPLPVADIAEILGASAPALPATPSGVVISAGGRRVVVACDELVGREEVVIKPLGPIFAGTSCYLGSTLLGDRRIALLVQPTFLTHGSRKTGGDSATSPSPAPPAPHAPATPAGSRAVPPQAGEAPEGAGQAGPAPGRGGPDARLILVVEDSFTVRELQRSILEAAGYRVTTARDGREALAVLDREPEIALVVTDIEMPELDGLALTRAIRSDPERSSLPVVVVTTHDSDEARREGSTAGADAYMVKRDFDQQALLDTVGRLLGR